MARQQHEETSDAAGEGAGSTRPVAKFSGSGGLNAAVWKHKTENGAEHYSVRLDRTYKNEAGEYESTAYLREGDLLRAQKLLGQVDDWIEQDRAKYRSSQRQSGAER